MLDTKMTHVTTGEAIERVIAEQRRFIRKQFDSAMTRGYAEVMIQVAGHFGYPDLAEEMQNDLI